MPTYNYGRYVADAIESIQAQTFGNFEIVVVDDGSTDDTAAILAASAEPRLKVIRQERAGTASARNRGLEAARGEFITWLDADDLWKPAFLERHLAVLEAEPEVGYSFSNFMRTRDGVPLPGTQFDLVPRLRQLPTRAARGGTARVVEMDAFAALAPSTALPGWLQASVFRRAALEGRRCDPRLKAAEDLFLLLQVYAGGTRVAFLEEVLVEVRRHGQNSYATGEQIQNAVIESVLFVDADIPLTASQQAILRRRIANRVLRPRLAAFLASRCRQGCAIVWSSAAVARSASQRPGSSGTDAIASDLAAPRNRLLRTN
jgi:cellulose synthase/poly-beta-1,6-N-acetylglucosamine synthase-like glycosyltransferase